MFKYFGFPMYMDTDEGGGSGESQNEGGGSQQAAAIDYSKIDWTKVDVTAIPKDVVKKIPAYEKVLNESIDRRKKIAELTKPTDEDTDTPAQTSNNATQSNDGLDEIRKMITELSSKMTQGEQNALRTWQETAAREYGIKSEKVIKTLQGGDLEQVRKEAETVANELGIPKPVTSSGSSVGNPSQQRDKSVLERAKSKMNGSIKSDVYDTAFQSTIGGGFVDRLDN